MEIRNIAIIAHVDHGKTTLTDALLRQTGLSDETLSMDSDVLEKERGITIYAKNTALFYQGTKINIVDTPGHADFGSEVERVLRSIDSVLLVVDAQEGPMPQTRYVLKKSLELGLRPIVVINKIDKPAARIEAVEEMILELFMNLGANNKQLDFPVIYTIGSQGIARKNLADQSKDLTPLLAMILEKVPVASHQTSRLLRFQPFNLAYDDFLGRMGIGRVYEGVIKKGEKVIIKKPNGEFRSSNITKIFTFQGFDRQEVDKAEAGDIAMVSGIGDIDIGETICHSKSQKNLSAIHVDEPTISVHLMVNNSPLAGQEGKKVTNSQLKARLKKELEVNVGLKIDFDNKEYYKIFGRGEMHLVILFEQMRREGYEMQVSQPHVIYKEKNNKRLEPFELVTIDVPNEMSGAVIEKLQSRKGVMTNLCTQEMTRLTFEIPSRGLLGYRGEFIMDTRGEGTISSENLGFQEYVGEIKSRSVGSMVSMTSGKALGYALFNLQNRGQLYIKPNTVVYEGMVIGNTAKGDEMTVNPTKGKKLTNMRASGSDEAINLIAPIDLTIERGLEFMDSDEYLEITPRSIRLRKKFLKETDRHKSRK
ncbi:MAG: translational GTPase TypA [Patescibacteria group bacterium]|nr:translational GTPase TypA [Patescibacteria group bacterium]